VNRNQIERAERVSEILAARRMRKVESLQEAREWTRPRSLAQPKKETEFTEEQILIALRVLDKNERL